MKKILFIITLIAFAACAKFAPEHSYTSAGTDMTEPVETKEVTICASAPDNSVPALPASKTVLDGNKVKWSAGDVVKVCFPTYNHYSFYYSYNGKTFLFTSQGSEGDESSLFKGEWSSSSDFNNYGFIMYPQTVEFSSTDNRGTYTYTFNYTLPDAQEAVDNSFAKDLNLAYAPVSKADMDANTVKATFKNLCGLIRIVLPQEEYNIKSITIESTNSNGSGVLHGKAALKYGNSDGVVSVQTYPTSTPKITLKKADDSNLTPGAAYYAVVWPTKTHAALKFTFTDANGNEAVKQTPSGKTYTFYAGQYHTFNITSLSFGVASYLTVGESSLSPKARGTSGDFTVTANNSWTAVSSDNSWLTVTKGDGMVSYTVEENTEPVSRTATITITSADITKTVTVTQPPVYYKSSTGTPISTAASLENGSLYMIYFATGNNKNEIDSYCWKSDYTNGDVSAYDFSDRTANATCDLVFKYHKTTSITDSWKTDDQSYGSAASGYLQSMYNGKYMVAGGSTILDFATLSTSDAVNLIFANQWTTDSVKGSDIDVYNYDSRSNTIYWSGGTIRNSGALTWTSNMNNTPRKWFFVKVTEVQ